jgi:hypothetical protein
MTNTVGATYSIDRGFVREYKEMFSHTSERVQLQESFYTHLKNKLTTFDQFLLTKAQIIETLNLANPNGKGMKVLVKRILGLELTFETARALIDE